VVGHVLLQFLPRRLRRMRPRRRVHAEAAQLDAFVAEVMEHVNDLVEVGRRFLLVEDVRPAADRKLLLHGWPFRLRSVEGTPDGWGAPDIMDYRRLWSPTRGACGLVSGPK